MANLQLPINQDHEVLGSEYCSGYMDALGKWNTGFYCPASDESQDVFCCGTESHKYCCTKKDQVIQSEVQDLTVLIGVLVGASAAIMIITLVSCFCCSCCLLYKKRNPSTLSMYRLHNSSEHSGVTNMYSLSASRSGTPTLVLGNNNQTSALLHTNHHAMGTGTGILIGGVNHPSNHAVASTNLAHPHLHNHNASQFTLQLDELDQMQMMQQQQQQLEAAQQPNGGMSHSHTLPHNLSHHHRYRASPDIISHQVTAGPHVPHYHSHHHNQHEHQHHHEAVHQHYNTLGRMPLQPHHHYPHGIMEPLLAGNIDVNNAGQQVTYTISGDNAEGVKVLTPGPNDVLAASMCQPSNGGTNAQQCFDMLDGHPTANIHVNSEGEPRHEDSGTTSFIGNLDVVEAAAANHGMEGFGGGSVNTVSHNVVGSGKMNPTGSSASSSIPSQSHTQPQVVYATHAHHHGAIQTTSPKENQQLFHSTKF